MPNGYRHVDVSRLTDAECSHVVDVIGKDIVIRKRENDRILEQNKKLQNFRRAILLTNSSRKKRFPFDDYCLCGRHMFTFCIFERGEECVSCENYCCSTCRFIIFYEGEEGVEKFYICRLCSMKRDIKRKTMAWFYETVEKRFKRFGSSKVLRAVYKQNDAIEPRVITLLALCRELQPAKRVSFKEIKRKLSTPSMPLDGSYVSSNISTTTEVELRRKKNSLSKIRKRYSSESELARLNPKWSSASAIDNEMIDARTVKRNQSLEFFPSSSPNVQVFYIRKPNVQSETSASKKNPEKTKDQFY